MKYRLILFDFDGTLADTFPWVISILDQLAERFDVPRPPDSEIEAMRGVDTATILQQYRVSLWKLAAITSHVRELMQRDLHTLALFPGIERILHFLADRGAQLGVVSSSARANIEHVLGPDITNRMSYFECGVSIFGKTPKLRKILRESGISPAETIYIGDETRDCDAARMSNIAFGAVAWGYARLDALLQRSPDLVFHQVDDLMALKG